MKNSFKIPFVLLVALLLGSIASQAQTAPAKTVSKPGTTTTNVVRKEKKSTTTKTYYTKGRAPSQNSASAGNKVKKEKTAAKTTTPATHKTMAMHHSHNTSGDKVHGKDKAGHTLYQSPNGGIYYFNAQGNKEYVKQDH